MMFMYTGCNTDAVSIEDRISMFMEEINKTDRSDVWVHLHPDANQTNTNGKLDSFWGGSGLFPEANITYSLSSQTVSNSIVTATIAASNGTPAGWSGASESIKFTMKEDGTDIWFINKIELPTGTTIFD